MSFPASRTATTVLGDNTNASAPASSGRDGRSLLPFLHAKRSTTFGFWNMQRSLRDGLVRDELRARLEQNQVQICGLVGAWKWKTDEHIEGRHTILWSGTEASGHGCGVGLLLGARERSCLTSWEAVSDRLLWARFSGTINLSVVVAYAPTSERHAHRKRFFGDLQQLLQRIPGLDFQLVLGDFNSQVGSPAARGEYSGVLGSHGVGQRTASGEELLQFCQHSRLCITNSFFQHRAAHKVTWNPPQPAVSRGGSGGGAAAQRKCLDYVLVKRQWLSSVRDVRVRRGANPGWCFSDHQLLTCRVRLKLKPPRRRAPTPRPSRSALLDRERREQVCEAVEAALQAAPAQECPQREWGVLAPAMLEAARKVLPPEVADDLQPHRPHVSGATLALVAQRRELKWAAERQGRSQGSPAVRRQLQRLRHRITRSIKRDRSRHAAMVAQRLQQLAAAGNSHAFYAGIKQLGGQRAVAVPVLELRGADGTVARGLRGVTEAFAGHFEEVHRCGLPVAPEVLAAVSVQPGVDSSDDHWPLPTAADTMDAVSRLKHWRASDPSGVHAELLAAACGSASFRERFHRLVTIALLYGMPQVVKESELLPLFKKGDAAAPGNYRGIQLISLLRKVLALILSKDLCWRLEPTLLEYQCGFRPQRSCADQLFTLRKLCELAVEWQQRLYVAFVDLRKAFDSLHRPALWAILRSRGIPGGLIRVLEDLHTDTTCRVRMGGRRSRSFRMEYGVQQGCPLASPLFNVFFDHVVREALASCPGAGISIRRRRDMAEDLRQPSISAAAHDLLLPVLMLADDLAVLAPSADALRQFVEALEVACRRWGLVISSDKTELMLVGGAAALACEQCTRQQPEGDMLICDQCGRGWHMACMSPPLMEVPDGQWCCPMCDASMGSVQANVWKPIICVDGQPLNWVGSFKYLGSAFHENGGLDAELNRRIQLAALAFRQLQRPFFRQRCIAMCVRMQVYSCMVTSVLLYGSEAWALNESQLERLEVFHRRCLRNMLGVRMADHVSNEVLRGRCNASTVNTMLTRRQLRWLGHLGRMGDCRIAKQMLYSTMAMVGRRRRVGRQPVRLCTRYTALVEAHFSRAKLRGLTIPREDCNWLAICKNRQLYNSLCP